MFSLNTYNIISMHKGDDLEIVLTLDCGDNLCPIRYELGENDIVYFAIMENCQSFENALVRKVFTKDNLDENKDVVITLTPNDTICLLPTDYWYEIKLKRISNDKEEIHTVVPKTKFTILE